MKFASIVLIVIGFAAPALAQPAKTRILFIGADPDHPHGSHMYLHTSRALARCAENAPNVEAIVSKGWPKDAKILDGVKAIVVYSSPAAEYLLGGPDREAVERTLSKGVGLVTIHWASSIRKENVDRLGPLWLKFTGATWVSNVGLSSAKAPLKLLQSDHPIGRGWKEFEVDDEIYLNPTIKDAKPLLEIRERKGADVVVGWAYDRPDKGRSFGTTLGHPYKNFQDDRFRRMIVNGILWSAGLDVPEAGANVDIPPELLALPPQPPKK